MKRSLTAACLFLTLASATFAVEFKIGPTLDEVHVSGVRAYGAGGGNNNTATTSSRLAGGIFVRAGLGSFEIDANYRYISGLHGSGLANSSDIFHDGGTASAVQTAYAMTEKIHELTASFGFHALDLPVVDFTLGPSASVFFSSVDFAGSAGQVLRSYTSHDLRLGAFARVSFDIPGPFSFDINYRYSTPPGRRLHSLGIGFGVGL